MYYIYSVLLELALYYLHVVSDKSEPYCVQQLKRVCYVTGCCFSASSRSSELVLPWKVYTYSFKRIFVISEDLLQFLWHVDENLSVKIVPTEKPNWDLIH